MKKQAINLNELVSGLKKVMHFQASQDYEVPLVDVSRPVALTLLDVAGLASKYHLLNCDDQLDEYNMNERKIFSTKEFKPFSVDFAPDWNQVSGYTASDLLNEKYQNFVIARSEVMCGCDLKTPYDRYRITSNMFGSEIISRDFNRKMVLKAADKKMKRYIAVIEVTKTQDNSVAYDVLYFDDYELNYIGNSIKFDGLHKYTEELLERYEKMLVSMKEHFPDDPDKNFPAEYANIAMAKELKKSLASYVLKINATS
ncbi:MAG: hypothetical protein A2076_06630 [Geobacteraceae bacterium GWC2_53_11]|nr:MAG: hypothetical protein A2076_06630 [Geobacteraceae bacterium GWC2_53_11]